MKLQKVKLNSLFVLLFCFIYALVRYVIIGPVDAVDIPVYILNKAVSWGAVTLLFFSISLFDNSSPIPELPPVMSIVLFCKIIVIPLLVL